MKFFATGKENHSVSINEDNDNFGMLELSNDYDSNFNEVSDVRTIVRSKNEDSDDSNNQDKGAKG